MGTVDSEDTGGLMEQKLLSENAGLGSQELWVGWTSPLVGPTKRVVVLIPVLKPPVKSGNKEGS